LQQFKVAITNVLAAPPKGTDLVIFADQRSYVAELDSHQMLASAARYAVRNKVYVVPERFVAADSLCLCMLAPDGSVLGVQRACHHNVSMRENNLLRADEIQPFDTPFGKAALIVDVDINMPQCVRSAVMKGACFIISSQYLPLYDFYEDRINYSVVDAAVTNGVQIAAAIGMGGVVVNAKGSFICDYSDDLPITAVIDPQQTVISKRQLHTAHKLMLAHRELIDQPGQGGIKHE